ncbi:S1 RNA-binding domain-containing protein [Spiroplasma endosymbiont of Aspidapion aeneum]|uniref:S1 RNA-binding domain-containing protein n=1 Tax=Spiroplasma endosymbiont of Aspidapion aeneum TaxID=3066276 RepID=UPI00313F3A9E
MVNEIIKVVITDIVTFGAFCTTNINDVQYKGLIHISEISNDYVNDIRDYLSPGQEVNAMILSIDDDKKQLSLSIKKA